MRAALASLVFGLYLAVMLGGCWGVAWLMSQSKHEGDDRGKK